MEFIRHFTAAHLTMKYITSMSNQADRVEVLIMHTHGRPGSSNHKCILKRHVYPRP